MKIIKVEISTNSPMERLIEYVTDWLEWGNGIFIKANSDKFISYLDEAGYLRVISIDDIDPSFYSANGEDIWNSIKDVETIGVHTKDVNYIRKLARKYDFVNELFDILVYEHFSDEIW